MKLQAVSLGTTLLSSNLKVGLLAGIVGVSASTGAVATSFSSESLGSAFKTATSPVKTFFDGNISPHFEKVLGGAKKIGGKLGNWGKEAYEKKDDALQWVKTNFSPSLLKSGLLKITNQTKSWAEAGKSTLSSTYGTGKNTVIPFLSESGKVRELLYYGSEASNVLKALGVLLTASAFTSAAEVSGGGGAAQEEEDDEEDSENVTTPPLSKFWELVKGGKLGEVIPAVWDLVTNNLNIVKQLGKPDVNRIVDFVLNKPDQVKQRVEEMKKTTESKDKKEGKDSEKWGNYTTTKAFMDALIPPPDLVKELLEILKTTLGSDFSNYLSDTNKTIPSENITSILGCTNGSSEGNEKGSGNTCPTDLNIQTLLEKLLGGVEGSSAPIAAVSGDK